MWTCTSHQPTGPSSKWCCMWEGILGDTVFFLPTLGTLILGFILLNDKGEMSVLARPGVKGVLPFPTYFPPQFSSQWHPGVSGVLRVPFWGVCKVKSTILVILSHFPFSLSFSAECVVGLPGHCVVCESTGLNSVMRILLIEATCETDLQKWKALLHFPLSIFFYFGK